MKMLASTVQFSSYGRAPRAFQSRGGPASAVSAGTPEAHRRKPIPQDPTACRPAPRMGRAIVDVPPMSNHRGRAPTTWPWTPALPWEGRAWMLLRKEVIQPHLPVRLPCYDFVPIASPTFDSSLHEGWATGFGCYRLS